MREGQSGGSNELRTAQAAVDGRAGANQQDGQDPVYEIPEPEADQGREQQGRQYLGDAGQAALGQFGKAPCP